MVLIGTSLISDCSELEYGNANMTDATEYYAQLKSQLANEKYMNSFLKQAKITYNGS